jgi:MarR family transcriptional regulator, negative regulator of the multidrug operon emrRAB
VSGSGVRRLENLLGSLLTALSDALTLQAERTVGHSGATAAALTHLLRQPGQSIDQLKAPLSLSQSATVRLVDRLAGDGLAERRPGRDGRSIAVHLTPGGVEVAHDILTKRREVLGATLASLGEAERDTMTVLLEKILDDITTDVPHGERICRLCDLEVCPLESCPVAQAAYRAAGQAVRQARCS